MQFGGDQQEEPVAEVGRAAPVPVDGGGHTPRPQVRPLPGARLGEQVEPRQLAAEPAVERQGEAAFGQPQHRPGQIGEGPPQACLAKSGPAVGQRQGRDVAVEERAARLDTGGEAGDVDLGQQVEAQVAVEVGGAGGEDRVGGMGDAVGRPADRGCRVWGTVRPCAVAGEVGAVGGGGVVGGRGGGGGVLGGGGEGGGGGSGGGDGGGREGG